MNKILFNAQIILIVLVLFVSCRTTTSSEDQDVDLSTLNTLVDFVRAGYYEGNNYAIDANNNLYHTSVNSELLNNYGDPYIRYINKYDANNTLIMQKEFENVFINSITISPNNDLFFVGLINRDTNIDGVEIKVNEGETKSFIGKLISDNYIEIVYMSSDRESIGITNIDIDTDNNIYLSAIVKSDLNFKGTQILGSPQQPRMMVACLNSDGNLIWINTGCGDNYSIIWDSSIGENNIAITGLATHPLYINNQLINQNGSILVSDINSDGSINWIKTYGGNHLLAEINEGIGIASSNSGDTFVAGVIYENTSINGEIFDIDGYSGDFFLMKLDKNGKVDWVQQIIGETSLEVWLKITPNNTVTFSAFSQSSIKVGDNQINSDGIVFANFDYDGNLNWIKSVPERY